MPSASQTKKSSRPRHVPQRTCIGCRMVKPKRQLIRVVRVEDGVVEVDPTGKKSGRGTYLCKQRSCWEAALRKERLDRALKTRVAAECREGLASYAETLPQLSEG
jgi:predicted RNA-binding protein YlxR (DUF448 family)